MRVIEHLGTMETTVGTVAVVETPDPFTDHPAMRSYVAIVTRPAKHYHGERIVMIVTVRDPDNPGVPQDLAENLPSATIENVYASDCFRVPGDPRPAVAVGVFLRQAERFRLHSTTRSCGGDRWAQAVAHLCGDSDQLPARSPMTDDEKRNLERNAEKALARLRAGGWWQSLLLDS